MQVDTHGTLMYVSERLQLTAAPFNNKQTQSVQSTVVFFAALKYGHFLHVLVMSILLHVTGFYSCGLFLSKKIVISYCNCKLIQYLQY